MSKAFVVLAHLAAAATTTTASASHCTVSYAFASDNMAGAHPAVLDAIANASTGYHAAYGNDAITKAAVSRLLDELGVPGGGAAQRAPHDARVYFVPTGTAANVLALKALVCDTPAAAVIATSVAHINTDEAAAPESQAGVHIYGVGTPDGKLDLARDLVELERIWSDRGIARRPQPAVLSLTQPTEYGTGYSIAELEQLRDWARGKGLAIHVDGARLAVAAAALNVSLAALVHASGADAVSLGFTKNGALDAEVVVFTSGRACVPSFQWLQKSAMAVFSKAWAKSAQAVAMLDNGLWLHNARTAVRQRVQVYEQLIQRGVIAPVDVRYAMDGNVLVLRLPRAFAERLLARYAFYAWGSTAVPCPNYRFVTSWKTSDADVADLVDAAVEEKAAWGKQFGAVSFAAWCASA